MVRIYYFVERKWIMDNDKWHVISEGTRGLQLAVHI